MAAFNVSGKSAPLTFEEEIEIPADRDSWLVARVQDKVGKWCLTSPVYFEGEETGKKKGEVGTVLFQISNASRFADLGPDFFGHAIATVREPERIASVTILRDEADFTRFVPSEGNRIPADGKIPTTGMWGHYSPGWIWFPDPGNPHHFQADFEVRESGWYRVVVETDGGRFLRSSAMHFDAANPLSHSLSAGSLFGPRTELVLWGYGADIERKRLHPTLNPGSWWYPKEVYWQMKTRFGDTDSTIGWPREQPVERFRD